MAQDYYGEARQLARQLADEGFEGWAKRIEGAITDGFTATEILMALRWQSRQIQEARLSLSSETNRQLKKLLAGLEQALV